MLLCYEAAFEIKRRILFTLRLIVSSFWLLAFKKYSISRLKLSELYFNSFLWLSSSEVYSRWLSKLKTFCFKLSFLVLRLVLSSQTTNSPLIWVQMNSFKSLILFIPLALAKSNSLCIIFIFFIGSLSQVLDASIQNKKDAKKLNDAATLKEDIKVYSMII